MLLIALTALPRAADAQSIIRDTEIELILKQYAQPIFEQAGIGPDDVTFVIVESPQLNAFVAGGMNMFFYTGLILEAEDAKELVGVMAHETSHIAAGHLSRMHSAIDNASLQSILTTVIGIAAAIGTGEAGLGAAIHAGGQQMALRNFLKHNRTQESAADHGGVRYLNGAHISPEGMMRFMQKLEDQELLPESQQSEYVRTHPITRDRISYLRRATEESPYTGKPLPDGWDDAFDRMRLKLLGYLYPDRALRLKPDSRGNRYARAIALYRKGLMPEAIEQIDGLIAQERGNPFLYELKGQVLFENGMVDESIPPLRKAVSILPDAPLIAIMLAHALVEQGEPGAYDESIRLLKHALRHEHRSAFPHRLLATAYGKTGRDGLARLHLAEEALLQNRLSDAAFQATLAIKKLENNGPATQRARDLLDVVNRRQKKD